MHSSKQQRRSLQQALPDACSFIHAQRMHSMHCVADAHGDRSACALQGSEESSKAEGSVSTLAPYVLVVDNTGVLHWSDIFWLNMGLWRMLSCMYYRCGACIGPSPLPWER